jgi:hypothetical protein
VRACVRARAHVYTARISLQILASPLTVYRASLRFTEYIYSKQTSE